MEFKEGDLDTYKLVDWYAEKNGHVTGKVRGEIMKTTKKAILLRTKYSEVWIPKSCIVDDTPAKDQGVLV